MSITLAFYIGRLRANPKVRLFDRLVTLVTRGPYSHVELIDPDNGTGWSSSWRDKGVRNKAIDWSTGHWAFLTLPGDAREARDRIKACLGMPYDLWGLLFFVLPWRAEQRRKVFCSEVVAFALELMDPWSYSPNSLYTTLRGNFEAAPLERLADL